MIDRLLDLVCRPVPFRVLALRKLLRTFSIGSYPARLLAGCVERPWYGWCLFHAASEAKALGHSAMTVLELGVAGGSGLLCLARHRDEIKKTLGTDILLYGLDTGAGLPSSEDSRDLLYCWPPGSFEMNLPKLRRETDRSSVEVVLGDVRETVRKLQWPENAPLGAVMFDLDLYTSTRDALAILDRDNTLPRLWCYFDDVSGYPDNCLTDAVGVPSALSEFESRGNEARRLGRVRCFAGQWPEGWHEKIYCYHRLDHPEYNRCLSAGKHQLSLR